MPLRNISVYEYAPELKTITFRLGRVKGSEPMLFRFNNVSQKRIHMLSAALEGRHDVRWMPASNEICEGLLNADCELMDANRKTCEEPEAVYIVEIDTFAFLAIPCEELGCQIMNAICFPKYENLTVLAQASSIELGTSVERVVKVDLPYIELRISWSGATSTETVDRVFALCEELGDRWITIQERDKNVYWVMFKNGDRSVSITTQCNLIQTTVDKSIYHLICTGDYTFTEIRKSAPEHTKVVIDKSA